MVDCVATMHISDGLADHPPNMKRNLSSTEQPSLKKLRYSSSDSAFSTISDELPTSCTADHYEQSPLPRSPHSATPVTMSTPSFSTKQDDDDDHHHVEKGITPVDDDYESDCDEPIATFADSFSTGNTGAQGWTENTLVQVLTNDIEDLCMANENAVNGREVDEDLKIFFSQYRQQFEMHFYVGRLVQYSNCSASAFVAALVYLDRVHLKCRQLSMTEMNCHRLLSTALVLAIKYLDDEVYANSYYARVSGLTLLELNALEAKMLNILDWRLTILPEEYLRYEVNLHKTAAILDSEPVPLVSTSDVSSSTV